jgi:uncharacterized protein (DUF1015 family)
MPKEGTDLNKWSVVACDQYTSEPEYWKDVEDIVGDAPSTLKLTLPEVYLGNEDEQTRVDAIHSNMKSYVDKELLVPLDKGFVLVERDTGREYKRNGIVVSVDLETYEYRKGEASLIRPTEMTVEERIPPRLKVRQTATIELPHIMLIIDDPECSIIEPLIARKDEFKKVYDTKLMKNGGHITGWLIPEGSETDDIMAKIEALASPAAFKERYSLDKDYPLLNMAVGDGNHSMATAKAAWEEIKKGLTDEEKESHPARYCLCEIVNIHDKSLEIEPIHRVIFGADMATFTDEAVKFYESKGCVCEINDELKDDDSQDVHRFVLLSEGKKCYMNVSKSAWGIPVATIQSFLDKFLKDHKDSKIDYIHGTDVVENLSAKSGNIGLILPEVKKEDLFIGVIKDGVLPRKTFSMGEAYEKRYYMECKSII